MKAYADIVGDGGSNIVAQVEDLQAKLAGNTAGIGSLIAIASGKGGVGKSTITVNLARAMAASGLRVGILDADINGSSVTHLMGLEGEIVVIDESGLRPVMSSESIAVMSVDLFLQDKDTPVVWDAPTQKHAFAWRGLMEANALRELVGDTAWGKLDYLLIDLPPGSDRISNVVDVLPRVDGILFITLPSALSSSVVARSLVYTKTQLDAPILGVVENMSGYECPCCGERSELFDGDTKSLENQGYEVLARIPFTPALAGGATWEQGGGLTDLAKRVTSLTEALS